MMDPLFVYDDTTSIPFSVEMNQGNLGARIVPHSGRSASVFEARFHIFGLAGAITPPMNPTVPVLRAGWVEDSIQKQRMLPIYPYLDNPDQDILQHLSLEDRDVAELLQAKVGNPGDGVFAQLHAKLPHKTTDGWRTLYQNSHVVIQMVLARIASPNQEQVKRLVLPFFSPPEIPLGQRPPGGADIRDRGHAVRAPSENQDDFMGEYENSEGTEQLGSDDRTDPESTAEPPSTSASSFVDQQPVVLDFIGDSAEDGEDGEYAEEDSDTKYTDRGRPLSPSETPPPRRGNQRPRNGPHTRGVKFTSSHRNAMVRFLRKLDREPMAADWEDFRTLTPENRVRSADAWRRKFCNDRKSLLADVFRLRAQGA